MEKITVSELKEHLNKEIISDFLVVQKELREGTKDFYIRLRLADKTGSIPGNVWNNAKSVAEKFEEGDVIRVKGVVISYKMQIQITVNKIQKLAEEEYEITEFMETTSKDVNKLSEKLFTFIDRINEPNLKQLLLQIFEDKEFYARFAKAPAAKTWHHNYIGGLLEHTISVATICDFAAHLYPVDKDLLITGALLHDIGKVVEYDIKNKIEFSVEGRLIGHIPLGDQLVCNQAARLNNFPPELLMKLRHLILSHHGEYEKASARLPQTLEAIVLHHADNLDAQTVGVVQIKEQIQNDDAEWSEFDRLNERYYYIK
ncbi:MAG: HD domain-containing protein [Candidatus Cloacimonadales bacterium]|nr:HD domain-containing protein [Candidatus Cloacimonadales bacterium]